MKISTITSKAALAAVVSLLAVSLVGAQDTGGAVGGTGAIADTSVSNANRVPVTTIPRIMVNGQPAPTDTIPVMIGGKMMVPVRFVAQSLGAQVEYFPRGREVQIMRGNNRLVMVLDSNTARHNGTPRVMEAPPVLRDGRTLLPLREVSRFLGAEATYNPGIRTVFINTQDGGIAAERADRF